MTIVEFVNNAESNKVPHVDLFCLSSIFPEFSISYSLDVCFVFLFNFCRHTVFDLFSALCAKLFQSGGKFLK